MKLPHEPRYVLISPCRNEAKFVRRTLDTVLAQSVLPWRWIIVDDGSTDETPAILREYADEHEWIRVLRREDRGARSVGPGVVDAFYAGHDAVREESFDYLCKLDVDLELPPRYFETLIFRMQQDPRIGSLSGKAYYEHPTSGKMCMEQTGDEMSIGAAKFYRRTCFEEIGGFVHEVMWDGIDCHRSRMLGWSAGSSDDEDLRFVHLRPMGTSDRGILRGRYRHGYGQYFMGSGGLFMAASCVRRLLHPPMIVGAAATAWGFLWSRLRGLPRYEDEEFRLFLRRYQRRALMVGKRRATAEIEERTAMGSSGSNGVP